MTHTDYYYRIVTIAELEEAMLDGVVPRRDLDRADGYLHMSQYDQILDTLEKHYADHRMDSSQRHYPKTTLFILHFPIADVDDKIKLELAPSRGQEFPHYYGDLYVSMKTQYASQILMDGDAFKIGKRIDLLDISQ